MASLKQRSYNCKDEELPVICGFAAFSLKRDLADFTSYAPKFTAAYVTDFETKIASVNEVIMPKSETLELKTITARLYAAMDGLTDPINRVAGYLKLANGGLTMNAADFGLTLLRKNVTGRNAEGVISSLHTVNNNLTKYAAELGVQGLTPELAARFANAGISIAADNQKQYEILSYRKGIVQNNLGLFNSLYRQLTEILRVGKILYKAGDAAKLQDYTFNALLKQVRIVSRQTTAPIPEATA